MLNAFNFIFNLKKGGAQKALSFSFLFLVTLVSLVLTFSLISATLEVGYDNNSTARVVMTLASSITATINYTTIMVNDSIYWSGHDFGTWNNTWSSTYNSTYDMCINSSWANDTYVKKTGDSMTGNLDMNGNDFLDIDQAYFSGHDYISSDDYGHIDIHAAWIDLFGNLSTIWNIYLTDSDGDEEHSNLIFGGQHNAWIYYNDSDLIMDPDVVGSGKVIVYGNLTANNICYNDGTNCNTTYGSTYNATYASGISKDNIAFVNQSNRFNKSQEIYGNLTVNDSISFGGEASGIRNLMYYQTLPHGIPATGGDGFRVNYVYDFDGEANNDFLVFEKTDGNDPVPDGGIAFIMTNSTNVSQNVLTMNGAGLINITNHLIVGKNITAEDVFAWNLCYSNGTGCPDSANYTYLNETFVPYTGATTNVDLGGNNLTLNGGRFSGTVWINDTLGRPSNINNLITSLEDLSETTLLGNSYSTLSVVGGQLNYTLAALYDASVNFNFNRTIYGGSLALTTETITLTCGTDITPVTNYVYFELVAGVPTLKTSSTYPTDEHIDVATFVVGTCAGTSATIYSYSRNRYEVDSFINRVLERFEESGTLYVDGFVPAANTTYLNVSSGGEFFNGIFEMTSTNLVSVPGGFYYINSTGNFVQATSLSTFTQYADGVAFSGGPNERINIIWGVVPINTTGGTGPTQMRLVAVIPNEPTVKYTSIADAIADNYGTANYFPPNSEVKNVFVPIARTIVRPNTDLFELFNTGIYYQDIRGKITIGGGSAAAAPVYWGVEGNVLSTTTKTYQVSVNELRINNTNYLYNAISAFGNINSYYQFNVWNKNTSNLASSDLVATSSIGSESDYFVDVGITGPTYNDTTYKATPANTSFLIASNTSLVIGTGDTNKIISFFVDSFTAPVWIMNMTSTSINIFKNVNMTNYNITANWFFGKINWSDVQNVPTNLEGSYNITYDNYTSIFLRKEGDNASGTYNFSSTTLYVNKNRFWVNATGVGIGTNTPVSILEVVGGVSITDAIYAGSYPAADGELFVANNIEVGGASVAGDELNLYENSITSTIRMSDSLTGTGAASGLKLEIEGMYNKTTIWNYEAGPMIFGTNNTEAMRLNGQQNPYDVNISGNVTSGSLFPGVTNVWELGSSTLRWLKGWFVNLDVSNNATIDSVNVVNTFYQNSTGTNTWRTYVNSSGALITEYVG